MTSVELVQKDSRDLSEIPLKVKAVEKDRLRKRRSVETASTEQRTKILKAGKEGSPLVGIV